MIGNLRSMREAFGLTRKELAEKTGLTERQLYSYEREENGSEPTLAVLSQLADFFEVSTDELLGRSPAYSAKMLPSPLNLNMFGIRIRKRREEMHLSRKDLSERAGITTAYLSVVEKGKKIPKIETCIRLLNALNMSADSAFMDSLVAAQPERASYLQSRMTELPPEQRIQALRAFELILKAFR